MPMRENYWWLEEPLTINLAHNLSHKEKIFSILVVKFLKTYILLLWYSIFYDIPYYMRWAINQDPPLNLKTNSNLTYILNIYIIYILRNHEGSSPSIPKKPVSLSNFFPIYLLSIFKSLFICFIRFILSQLNCNFYFHQKIKI